MIYCYIRKSTDTQQYDRQINILKEKGYINGVNCSYIFETYTGKTTRRPVLDNLINTIKENDTLIIESLSRLSRSGFYNTIELIKNLVEKKQINITILKENIHLIAGENMDASTKLLLNIFSILAEFERDLLSERTKEGLKAVKKRGVKLGRPTKYTIKDFIYTLELNANGLSVNNAIKMTKYPKSSFIKQLSMLRYKYNIQDKKKLVNILKEASYGK